MFLTIATISGASLVSAAIAFVVAATIFWLLWWLLSYVSPPEPFMKVGKVLLAVAAVLFLINFVLAMTGQPIIKW